jgi:hypothetical protein
LPRSCDGVDAAGLPDGGNAQLGTFSARTAACYGEKSIDGPNTARSTELVAEAPRESEKLGNVTVDAIGLGRDVGHCAALFDLPADGVGVVAFVGVHDIAFGKLFEQLGACRAVGDLAAREP